MHAGGLETISPVNLEEMWLEKAAQGPDCNTQKVTLAEFCVEFLPLFHEHDHKFH